MKLEIGYRHNLEIRYIQTLRSTTLGLRVLYCSDLHLTGFGRHAVTRILAVVAQCQPDIVLLGGDYVDTPGGFVYFAQLLEGLRVCNHVFAIAGNHDRLWGTRRIEALCREHAVTWIEKTSVCVAIQHYRIQIDGNLPSKTDKKADFSILCLHKPINPIHFHPAYDLIVAGHLHGSQIVLWENDRGLYPGRLLYRWNLLQTRIGSSLYVISKGVGDTLPLRYNCKRDVLLIGI